ncbi:putative oligoribonuclease [Megachile rotundata]|uniref:putative oligoribonuclease n=1 Tax=Megachile rotundata TaxID=143995 RepID=UPI000258F92A|nr:PREDICTED: probable oligoribonuclease [Megachile rotundata]XP_012151722.1 PREDICTED: probable oligoribonuclease [Megachile rotundata]
MTSKNSNCIVWIDLELSGLDIEKDTIIEVACVITDKDLKIMSKEFSVVINQPDTVLDAMNDWCTKHHTKSGLIKESRSSPISLKAAEQLLLNFLSSYVPKGSCPLAGNTIYQDRIFLFKLMPLVNDYLHYRIIDVSSVKELARRWNPTIYTNSPRKKFCHRALMDIKESIQELQYYKDKLFIPDPSCRT